MSEAGLAFQSDFQPALDDKSNDSLDFLSGQWPTHDLSQEPSGNAGTLVRDPHPTPCFFCNGEVLPDELCQKCFGNVSTMMDVNSTSCFLCERQLSPDRICQYCFGLSSDPAYPNTMALPISNQSTGLTRVDPIFLKSSLPGQQENTADITFTSPSKRKAQRAQSDHSPGLLPSSGLQNYSKTPILSQHGSDMTESDPCSSITKRSWPKRIQYCRNPDGYGTPQFKQRLRCFAMKPCPADWCEWHRIPTPISLARSRASCTRRSCCRCSKMVATEGNASDAWCNRCRKLLLV